MLIIRETGCGVYGNSLYYPLNFSINLKLLKIKCIFKKFKQVDAEECMQCNTIYIKFKTYKTIIAEEYREEFHPLLSLKVSVFLFHRNIYLVFEPSFVFVCIFVWSDLRELRSGMLFFPLWFTGTSISGIFYKPFISRQIAIKCLHAPGHTVLLEQIQEEKSCFSLPFQFCGFFSLHYVTF